MKILDRIKEGPSIADSCFDGAPVMPTPAQISTAAHRSGAALLGHMKSAHRGAFDPACRACKELDAKIVR
jgi:hypothetical protein